MSEQREFDEFRHDRPEPGVDGWSHAVDELLERWWRRVKAVEAGHHKVADRLSRGNVRLGIPVVVLSTLIGTSVFATLEDQVDVRIRVLIGVVSLTAAVLASLQTFLRYAERAEKHRQAAALYSSLRRDMEKLLALAWDQRGPAAGHIDRIRSEMDRYGRESPEIGEGVWDCGSASGLTSPRLCDVTASSDAVAANLNSKRWCRSERHVTQRVPATHDSSPDDCCLPAPRRPNQRATRMTWCCYCGRSWPSGWWW